MTVTWQWCCAADPRLLDLECDVRAFARSRRSQSAGWEWYGTGGFKDRLSELVGWGRKPPGYVEPPREPDADRLRVFTLTELEEYCRPEEEARGSALEKLTSEERRREAVLMDSRAYDAVYDHLLSLMPRF